MASGSPAMLLWHFHSKLLIQAGRLRTTVWTMAFALGLALVCAPEGQADETLPFIIQDSLYRTNIGINNLDFLPAEVSLLLYDNGGHLVAQGSVQIPSLGFLNLSQVVSLLFGYSYEQPFEGFIRLRSASRIAAFAAQIQNENSDPGIIASMPEDASHFLLPITTSINPWTSTLAIVNLAARATIVKISLRDESGSLLAETERSLEAASQWITPSIHGELGVNGVRGYLVVQSLDGAPLAVLCRHTQLVTRQDVFQQPFDLRKTGKVFYLPYWFAEGLHRSWVVLNNPDSEPASVALRPLSPSGIPLTDYFIQVPAFGAVLVPDSALLAGRGDRASYGLIRGTSTRPLGGLVIQTDLSSGDTIHTNLVTELSPEILIPSVTQAPPFSSSLLLGNLGEAATWIEISHRAADGHSTAAVSRMWLPARGTVYLDKVLTNLGIPSGYGPLQVRSLEGQPLAAFSHVLNNSGARGALNLLDTRPTVSKRVGERLRLRWQYDPAEISKIQEYRIYRADRATRNFQKIASVPVSVLEHSLDATVAGDFVLAVKAFNGVQESNPSNEVLLQVKP
ncbi:MAG: fibronectin type III domain-containing protein [Acidobacteria bacterium]|nr:fibronectin type III domain-containing protein [Acidobacteriota bacterium]MCI0718678.1 fibronectin type III domain-containing protein [Acidobacteriota bacterium]